MSDEPTDQDLITDHPFQQAHGFGLDDMCGWRDELGAMCGFGWGDHERPEGADQEVRPDDTP